MDPIWHPTPAPPALPVWFITLVPLPIVLGLLWYGSGFLKPLAITGLLFILGSALIDRSRGGVLFGWAPPGWLAHVMTASLIPGMILFYLAFLAAERLNWIRKIPMPAPNARAGRRLGKVISRIAMGIKRFMWVNAVTSAMSATVAFLIFSLVDLDFKALLALIVFVAGFIPSIGAFIATTPPSAVAPLQFESLTPFFVVVVGYGLADQFIANVVLPSMQGKSLNISTFMVMVSPTFWAMMWGATGAFLAVQMMVAMMVVFVEIPATRSIAALFASDGAVLDNPSDADFNVTSAG